MEDILKQFGIQPTLLIAQIVNFSILVFVLTKFLYKPLVKAIDARRTRIEESLRSAREVEEKRKHIEEQIASQLTAARAQAEEIIGNATKLAEEKRAEILAQAIRESGTIAAKAKIQTERDREQMEAEVRSRIGELAVAVAEKLLRGTLGKKELDAHLERALAETSVK